MQLTLAQIVDYTNGKLLNNNIDHIISNVVIDSRKITVNSLFIAIIGEHHDGHDYIDSSFELGAIACLVNENSHYIVNHYAKDNKNDIQKNIIVVKDTIKAIGDLAHNYRKLFNPLIVAITGSNGKTTVKEMLSSIAIKQFGAEYVLTTSGNFNNHIGVPLTLLQLNHNHKVAIIEMGMNHERELDYLSKMTMPNIAIINNVANAHIEFFRDIEHIAQAKAEIYHGLLTNKNNECMRIACINTSSPFYQMWLMGLTDTNITIINYGDKNTDYYLASVDQHDCHMYYTPIGIIKIKLSILGEHNYYNALTAITVAIQLQCNIVNIESALNSYQGFIGRLQLKRASNGANIIDDTYNANLESTLSALDTLFQFTTAKWCIFGELSELGSYAHPTYIKIADKILELNSKQQLNQKLTCLITIGRNAKTIIDNIQQTVNASINDRYDDINDGFIMLNFNNNQEVINYCKQYLTNNISLLIKGSHSAKLWLIADALVTSFNKNN